MKRCWLAIITWVVLLGVIEPPLHAQEQQSRATAPVLRMGRYDKSTEAVVSGTILSIQAQTNAAIPRGTYILLRSGALILNVHMGLFSSSTIPFKTGDQVQVRGSLIATSGGQILLARQVQSGNGSLTVRSSKGFVVRAHPLAQTQGQQ